MGSALCIAGLLLLAQTLGVLHGVAHPARPVAAQGPSHMAEATPAPARAELGSALIAALFGAHDDGGVDCRLFDQASHADLMPPLAAAALPPAPADVPELTHAASALCAQASGYLARGPPQA